MNEKIIMENEEYKLEKKCRYYINFISNNNSSTNYSGRCSNIFECRK